MTKGHGYANVVARSEDGEHLVTVATVTSAQFGCASLEHPALVSLPTGAGGVWGGTSSALPWVRPPGSWGARRADHERRAQR